MPATIYGYFGKNRVPIDTLTEFPANWLEMKFVLLEVAQKVYVERRQQTTTDLCIDQHLGGKSITKTTKGAYSQSKIHTARIPAVFSCRIIYSPKTHTVKAKNVAFNHPDLAACRDDYYFMEKQQRWTCPPVIPKAHLHTMGNIKQLLTEPTGLLLPVYSHQPQKIMTDDAEKANQFYANYAKPLTEPYAPKATRIFDEDKFEKEQE